jgi:hypothetical protein
VGRETRAQEHTQYPRSRHSKKEVRHIRSASVRYGVRGGADNGKTLGQSTMEKEGPAGTVIKARESRGELTVLESSRVLQKEVHRSAEHLEG